jgi:hypothetical protein
MTTIDATVADLLQNPRPVLCLDTCELLAAIEELPDKKVSAIEALVRIRNVLVTNPSRLLLVLTELVQHEWNQNISNVRKKAASFVRTIDEGSQSVHRAWALLEEPLSSEPSTYAESKLIDNLVALTESVMAQANLLDNHPVCFERAMNRVRAKRRPAHKGMIKDAIHLEHYLELSSRLQADGYTERRLFVSGNRSDFWNDGEPHIHPEIRPDLQAAGLEFFGDLRSAVGSLRI